MFRSNTGVPLSQTCIIEYHAIYLKQKSRYLQHLQSRSKPNLSCYVSQTSLSQIRSTLRLHLSRYQRDCYHSYTSCKVKPRTLLDPMKVRDSRTVFITIQISFSKESDSIILLSVQTLQRKNLILNTLGKKGRESKFRTGDFVSIVLLERAMD